MKQGTGRKRGKNVYLLIYIHTDTYQVGEGRELVENRIILYAYP